MNNKEKQLIDELVEEFRKSITMKFAASRAVLMNTRGADAAFHTYASCIADYFCIDKNKMLSKETRTTDYRLGRQILWWFCRTGESSLPFSSTKVGHLSGLFDHATVLHGVKKIDCDIDYDFQTNRDVKSICELLGFKLVKVGMNYTTVSATRQTDVEQVLKLA